MVLRRLSKQAQTISRVKALLRSLEDTLDGDGADDTPLDAAPARPRSAPMPSQKKPVIDDDVDTSEDEDMSFLDQHGAPRHEAASPSPGLSEQTRALLQKYRQIAEHREHSTDKPQPRGSVGPAATATRSSEPRVEHKPSIVSADAATKKRPWNAPRPVKPKIAPQPALKAKPAAHNPPAATKAASTQAEPTTRRGRVASEAPRQQQAVWRI